MSDNLRELFNQIEPYECTDLTDDDGDLFMVAAGYIAIVAYPAKKDWPKRNKFMEAAKAHRTKYYRDHYKYAALPVQKYKQYPERNINNQFKMALEQLEARITILDIFENDMIDPFFLNVLNKTKSIYKLSGISELAKVKYQKRNDNTIPEEYKNRIYRDLWTEGKRVLHLTKALVETWEVKIEQCEAENTNTIAFFLNHPEWVKTAILYGEEFRFMFFGVNKIRGLKTEDFIQIVYKN